MTYFDLLKWSSPNQREVLGEEEEKRILEKDVRVAMKRLNEKK